MNLQWMCKNREMRKRNTKCRNVTKRIRLTDCILTIFRATWNCITRCRMHKVLWSSKYFDHFHKSQQFSFNRFEPDEWKKCNELNVICWNHRNRLHIVTHVPPLSISHGPYVEFGGNGDEKLRFSHDNECSLSDESLPVAAHIKPSKRKPTDQATEQTIKFQYHRILSNICMKQSGFSQM